MILPNGVVLIKKIKIPLPFCFTLALIAIPQPMASVSGTVEQARGYTFSIKGKRKKKIQAVKVGGTQVSIFNLKFTLF